MGLSSWLQSALAGKNGPTRKTRQVREDFVQLFLTRLEDRRVLSADFALVADPMAGNTLVLSGFTPSETLTVRESGANYEFELAMGGVWTPGATSLGTANGEILSVAKSALDPLMGGLRIADSLGNDPNINFESANFSAMAGLFDIDGAGDITQDIGSSFLVSSLDADAASVTLAEGTNDFGTLGITADVASIADANSLVLDDVQIASSFTLNVTSGPSTQMIGSTISGTGSLTKAGLGTLILSEVNTYIGATNIAAGELQVNGEIGNGGPAGTVTVQSGAILSGAGTVNADVFGQAGSFITATGNGFTLGDATSALGFETEGVLNGNGFSVTLNDADAALLGSLTNLNGGTLSAINGVTVGNGDTLEGTGTVLTSAGALTIQSGGMLAPGNSPGIINTNNLVLESGAIYVVELNDPYQLPGTDYDQTNVTGTVTLNGATLQLLNGIGAPAAGTTVVLIQNDGTDPVMGTFNGLAQGDSVTIGDFTGRINYFGGDGNDVALEIDGALVFNNTGGGEVTVRENTANGTIEILKGGIVVGTRHSAGVTEIIINGDMTASDTLIVDYTGSFFTQTVTFSGGEDGGMADNDALIITGGVFGAAQHTFTSTGPGNSGTILYDVDGNIGTTGDQSTVIYTGLEPVDMTGSTITDLVFNLPGTNDQAVLEDDGIAGNGISQIRSQNGTFETTTFANPTGSLTINTEAPGGGLDVVNVQGLDSLYDADLTINAGTDDTVNFQTAATDLGTGTLTVTALTINVNAAVSTSGTGAIDLDATRNIAVAATGSLTTINGTIDLDANQGAPTSGNFAGIAITGGLVTSTNGAITLDGRGGDTDADNYGVFLSGGGQITSTGTATVNVTGIGGNGTGSNHGVLMRGSGSAILSQIGAITVTGTAGAGIGSRAVLIEDTATIGSAATSGTVLLGGNGGVIEFQDASGIETTNNTAAAVTIRDASDVILGNVTAVNGGLVIGVAQDVTGSVTQALGTAVNIINLTMSTDITTATPILLDSATNQIVTVGQIERGGALTIVDSTGGLTVNGPINSVAGTLDPVTITTTGGNLVIVGAIASAGGGDITLTSTDADLLVNANVTANAPGNITLAGQNVILNGSTVEVFGVVPGNIISTTPRNGIVQGLGIITINATGLTDLNANSTLRTGGGVIQITTDDIDIAGTASINSNQANGGVVIIRNASAGRNIELGGNTMVGVLGINDAELDRIGAQSLRIGRFDGIANAGTISITDAFSASLAALPTVQLFAGGDITQLGGAGFIAGNIGVETNGSVALGSNLNDAINSFAALAVGGVLFNDANALTVGFLADGVDSALPADGEAGISGVTSTMSFVDLRTVNGNLTILDIAADPIEVSAGGVNPLNNLAINFLAAGANTFININAGANVTSLAGAHRYTADNMDIDGTITASTTMHSVNLRNANANVGINLGAIADGGANTLELSDAELDNITTNLLAIGRNTVGNASGNITITNPEDPLNPGQFLGPISPAGTDTLHLITAGTVTDVVTVMEGAIVVQNLLIQATGGATLDNIAMNDVDMLAALITGPAASFTFMDLDNVTVGTVGRLIVGGLPDEAVGLPATFSGIDTNGGNVEIVSNAIDPFADPPLVGVGVRVANDVNTTSNLAGAGSGSITIRTMGTGSIVVDALLDSSGITAVANGQGGDILLRTDNASININAGSLLATGGGLAVDGGNITIDANGDFSDVIVTGNLVTNDIAGGLTRGNISITADDSVTISGDISTTGLGTVTITANDSPLDGNSDGALTMNTGSSIAAEMGLVALRTLADALDEATITVDQITTTTGNVLIDANGLNADVILRNTIATADGDVDVLADDSVNFQAAGMILVSAAGDVRVRANQDMIDGPGNDEIFMADGSLISTNTGTITLGTNGTGGGSITLGRLVTQNITNQAVTINSEMAVLDGGDIGGADIEAFADANSRVNIIARTGIGVGNAIETSARRFDVQNLGSGDVNIANTTTDLAVVIEKMTTVGGNIVFDNQSGTGRLTIGDSLIAGTRVSSGDALTNGGNITIVTSDDLRVIAPISTRDGRGGMFTLTGGAIFDAGAAIELGAGNINITTGSLDIFFNANLTITNGPAQFVAPRDIIVGDNLNNDDVLISLVDDGSGTDTFVNATTTPVINNSPIDSNITLQADSDGDEIGGVLVRTLSQVIASGSLTLEGSDLFADGLLAIALPATIQNGVHIERDPGNQVQMLAAGELTLRNRLNVADADIVIGGTFGTQTATAGPSLNVRIDANDNIYLADNTTVFSPADVIFGDVTGRDPVIDDGDQNTPSNLVINASGTTTFFGRVGAINPAMDATDNIDSLTTNIGGQTHIRGGIVSTNGVQIYADDVFINADTNQFDTTTFTAGGNVNFLGSIFGLDLNAGVIEDDLVLNIAGTTTISGLVGVNSTTDPRRIGDGTGVAITILSTGETLFNNQVFIESGFLQDNAAGRITFKEDVNIDFDQSIGGIGSVFNADVTLDSLTINSNGELTFGNNAPNEDELFVFVGSRLNTGSESRNITINSRLVDPVENNVTLNEDLLLNLNQGDLVINGSVGDASMLNRFGDLVIQSANGFAFNGNTTTVTLISESLTQWDGIDNPSDADPFAATVLSGIIDVTNKLQLTPMDPTGITLATGNVIYNATITTNGGRILTQARSNISHTQTSSMTTLGGMVVSDAIGVIIMNEGSTINTNNLIGTGGMVVMQSGSDTTISKIVSTNGFVGLIAGGAIIDGGDLNLLGSANDIQTGQLRLQAGTGIGVVGNAVLETEVSNLETLNGTGRTLISNTGNLTIGGVGTPTVETIRTFIMDSGTAFTSVFTSKTIGLPSIGGMKNLNGDIGLTTVGNLTALGGTLTQSTNGSVALFVQGSAVFGGQVQAVNNGHIFVDVSGNFTLLNGQAAGDLQTDGIGQIVVTADGAVNFNPDSGAMVQSGTGTIRQPRPAVPLQLISTPQVTTEGVATLTFTVGLPGEKNFQVIIDWGDGGPLEIRNVDAGQHTIEHDYVEPPDPTSPGSPIRIFLVVANDPSIHFFGNNLSQPLPAGNATLISLDPPATGALPKPAPPSAQLGKFLFPNQGGALTINQFVDLAINPLNFNTLALPNALDFINQSLSSIGNLNQMFPLLAGNVNDLGVVSAVPVFQVPTTAFGGAAIIDLRELPPIFVPGNTSNPLPDDSDDFDDDAEDLEFSGSSTEEQGEDEVIVRLRVLSPAGQKLFEYEIDPKYLSNPAPLWARLTDGRYQIVIEEPGSSVPIVVRDVELRDHKVIRTFDRTRRDSDAEARRDGDSKDAAVSLEDLSFLLPEALEDIYAPTPSADAVPVAEPGPDAVWENWRPPHAANRLSRPTTKPEEATADAPTAASAFAGGLALATLAKRSKPGPDSQMNDFSKRTLSPAARLRRRLRK